MPNPPNIEQALQRLISKKVYIDANPIIYFLEGNPEFNKIITAIFTARNYHSFEAVSGELCLAETLVKPLKQQNALLISQIHQLFDSSFIQLLPHNRPIFELSADIRANNGLKTPDSIHVATALYYQVDVFITADNHLAKKPFNLDIINLNDYKTTEL